MSWKISFILLSFLAITSCKRSLDKSAGAGDHSIISSSEYFSTEHLIEVDELLTVLNSSSYKVIDFRKKEEYSKNHIPGAINIWRTDIENPSYPYQGMMASQKTLESLFSKLGIQNSDSLVIYDNRGACDAARLWWVLQNYDYHAVKLLNGGLNAWLASGGSVSKEVVEGMPTSFKFSSEEPSMQLMVSKEKVLKVVKEFDNTTLLDTRSWDEFAGKRQKKGASRAGRIPKSKWIDWAQSINYDTTKKFRSYNDLNSIYGTLGVAKHQPIITYCHSGVRSAHTTFVLTELLGYSNVKNYDGSWVEWSYMEQLPISKDTETTIVQ